MLLSIIILLIAFLLIFLEFYLPGGIMGGAGGILFVGGLVSFALKSNSWLNFAIFAVVAFVLLALLIKVTLWHIKRNKTGHGGIYHSEYQAGYTASHYDKELIGEDAEALSVLKPAGYIIVKGQRYQAVSLVGYIKKGVAVKVVGGEGSHYTVKLK
jgi:membrane-bound ClpP family serine protease